MSGFLLYEMNWVDYMARRLLYGKGEALLCFLCTQHSTPNTWSHWRVGFHTKRFSDTGWVSYCVTQSAAPHLEAASGPTGQGPALLSPTHPSAKRQSQGMVSRVPATPVHLGHKSEVPRTSTREPQELRKTVYLLGCRFVIKRYSSGTARWQRCVGQKLGTWVERILHLMTREIPISLYTEIICLTC